MYRFVNHTHQTYTLRANYAEDSVLELIINGDVTGKFELSESDARRKWMEGSVAR